MDKNKNLVMLLVGIVFLLVGNYMPKTRQNYVIGIRLPWTLNDSDNWNKTHRLAGILWILSGIAFIIMAFSVAGNLIMFILAMLLVAISILVPTFYSYSLYRKSKKVKEDF